jgi:KDO2-lipid IV(A) lauroyltransferase
MVQRVKYYFIVGIIYSFSFLPFPVLYLFSDFLAFVLKKIIRYRSSTIRENLFYSFPEKSKEEREIIVDKFYAHLADLIVEVLKMFTMDKKSIQEHFFTPLENATIDPKVQEGLNLILRPGPCIGMLGHYGNWEWASFCSCINFPGKENWVVYKPLSDKNFDKLFNKVRSRYGAELIEMKNVLRKFAGAGQSPFIAYFVSDQSPMTLSSHHKITFLNQETLVYLGAEKIAHSRNIPVVYVEIEKIRRGVYTTRVEKLTENPESISPEEINLLFQRRLEKTIQEKPEFWLWSHKRWKYTRN